MSRVKKELETMVVQFRLEKLGGVKSVHHAVAGGFLVADLGTVS